MQHNEPDGKLVPSDTVDHVLANVVETIGLVEIHGVALAEIVRLSILYYLILERGGK